MGHARSVHQGVGNGFVHADGAAQHAAAHVGDAGHLKQALNGAVLAVFAVHDRGADVNADKLGLAVFQQPDTVVRAVRAEHTGRAAALLPTAVGHGLGRGVAGQPAAGLGDAHREYLILFCAGALAQGAQPGRGRHAADLMLAGDAAEEERNAQLGITIHQKDSLCKIARPLGAHYKSSAYNHNILCGRWLDYFYDFLGEYIVGGEIYPARRTS